MKNRVRSCKLMICAAAALLFAFILADNVRADDACNTIHIVLYRYSAPFVGDSEFHPFEEMKETDYYRTYIEKVTDSGSSAPTSDSSFVEGKTYDAYVVFEIRDKKKYNFDDEVRLQLVKATGEYVDHPLVSRSAKKLVAKFEFSPVDPVEVGELNISTGKVYSYGRAFDYIIDNPYLYYNKMPVMKASFYSDVRKMTDRNGNVDFLKAEKYAIENFLENDKDYSVFFGLRLKDGYKYSPDCKVTVNGSPVKIISMNDRDGYAVYNIHYKDGHKITSSQAEFSLDGFTYLKYPDSNNLAIIKGKNARKVVIPDHLKINGKKYKVVFIGMEAFKNKKKIRSLTVGRNVKWIKAGAFKGCKKLSSINIKTKKLGDITVASDAFAGISKNVKVKCPKKKYKSYQSILDGCFGKSKVIFTK